MRSLELINQKLIQVLIIQEIGVSTGFGQGRCKIPSEATEHKVNAREPLLKPRATQGQIQQCSTVAPNTGIFHQVHNHFNVETLEFKF